MKVNAKIIIFILVVVVIVTLSLVFVKKSEKPITVVENINIKSSSVEVVSSDNEATSKLVTSTTATTNTAVESGTTIIVGEVAEYVQIARERIRQFEEISDDAEAKWAIRGETISVIFDMSRLPESLPEGQGRRLIGPRYYTRPIVIDIKTKAVLKGPGEH